MRSACILVKNLGEYNEVLKQRQSAEKALSSSKIPQKQKLALSAKIKRLEARMSQLTVMRADTDLSEPLF